MGAAEANQGIGGVTKADECAANLQIQIALWRACDADLPEVEDNGEKKGEGQCTGCKQYMLTKVLRGNRIPVAAEKPDDCAPNTHKIPQIPKKNYQLGRTASLCPFLAANYCS